MGQGLRITLKQGLVFNSILPVLGIINKLYSMHIVYQYHLNLNISLCLIVIVLFNSWIVARLGYGDYN